MLAIKKYYNEVTEKANGISITLIKNINRNYWRTIR